MISYDLLVIGHDRGGQVAALTAAAAGLSVALVARSLDSSEVVLETLCEVAAELPTDLDARATAWRRFRALCDQRAAQRSQEAAEILTAAQVTVIAGDARLLGKQRVLVSHGESSEEVSAQYIVLAAGSRPLPMANAPFDDRVLAAEDLNRCQRRPDSVLVHGSGPEALETAWALQALGCQVTWAIPAADPLRSFERPLLDMLWQELQDQGVEVRRQTKVRSLGVNADGIHCLLDDRLLRREGACAAQHLIVARGRRPQSSNLGLNTVAAVVDKRGHIQVDHAMQTGEPHLYAVGDLLPTMPGPFVAAREGSVAASHLLGQAINPIRYQRLPVVARSSPGLGAIGLTQEIAEQEGFLVRRKEFVLESFCSAGNGGPDQGRLDLIIDKESHQILGLHLLGSSVPVVMAAATALLGVPDVEVAGLAGSSLATDEVAFASAQLAKTIKAETIKAETVKTETIKKATD